MARLKNRGRRNPRTKVISPIFVRPNLGRKRTGRRRRTLREEKEKKKNLVLGYSSAEETDVDNRNSRMEFKREDGGSGRTERRRSRKLGCFAPYGKPVRKGRIRERIVSRPRHMAPRSSDFSSTFRTCHYDNRVSFDSIPLRFSSSLPLSWRKKRWNTRCKQEM